MEQDGYLQRMPLYEQKYQNPPAVFSLIIQGRAATVWLWLLLYARKCH